MSEGLCYLKAEKVNQKYKVSGRHGWCALRDGQSLKSMKQTGYWEFQAPAAEAAKAGTVPSATSLGLPNRSVACREAAAGQLSQDSESAVRSGSRL